MSSQSDLCDSYLAERSQMKRLALLSTMQGVGNGLSLSLAEDLLKLGLSVEEKTAILRAVTTDDSIAFEHLLTKNLLGWPQELACAAIITWFDKTQHLLWYRMLKLVSAPLVPQRVRYTILSRADLTGGPLIIEAMAALEGLEDMSPAFHSLLLLRACQWSYHNPVLEQLAKGYFEDLTLTLHPEAKALPAALFYLRRYNAGYLRGAWTNPKTSESWRPVIESTLAHDRLSAKDRTSLNKCLKALGPKTSFFEIYDFWPTLNNRAKLTESQIAPVMELWLTSDDPSGAKLSLEPESSSKSAKATVKVVTKLAPVNSYRSTQELATMPAFWEVFGGIDGQVLRRSVEHLPNSLQSLAVDFIRMFEAEIPGSEFATYIDNLELIACSERLRVLTDGDGSLNKSTKKTNFKSNDSKLSRSISSSALLHQSEQTTALQTNLPTPLEDFEPKEPLTTDEVERRAFLNLSTNAGTLKHSHQSPPKKSFKPRDKPGYFATLHNFWNDLQPGKLAQLAAVARLETGPWRLCYIQTLGRYTGVDEAALKLLDFIRSDEQDDLFAVMKALRSIATPRAYQELIASLTRPNVALPLRIEICRLLRDTDLTHLQAELRGALNDLQYSEDGDGPEESENEELRDAIATLLLPQSKSSSRTDPTTTSSNRDQELSDQSLDKDLSGRLPFYRSLSSEVKRALRTARFFDIQVSRDHAPESIDLSPVIDMQYKALELYFRELFEDVAMRLIQSGKLQRRLDVIGYARPIPPSMDKFEHYIARLPVVVEIPFFSKFKLRKMLRAISQYRPGRRFTLDGLKAFALFFLCFGRKQCDAGLGGLLDLGFRQDEDLYYFAKELHVMQDFRNRAAHEGFHPDASSDIEGIWRATAEIIQTATKIKEYMMEENARQSAPKNRSRPIIEKKVS